MCLDGREFAHTSGDTLSRRLSCRTVASAPGSVLQTAPTHAAAAAGAVMAAWGVACACAPSDASQPSLHPLLLNHTANGPTDRELLTRGDRVSDEGAAIHALGFGLLGALLLGQQREQVVLIG